MWGPGRAMSDRSSTAKADALAVQDKSHPGEPVLVMAVPTLLVVVNSESMVPTAIPATRHFREQG